MSSSSNSHNNNNNKLQVITIICNKNNIIAQIIFVSWLLSVSLSSVYKLWIDSVCVYVWRKWSWKVWINCMKSLNDFFQRSAKSMRFWVVVFLYLTLNLFLSYKLNRFDLILYGFCHFQKLHSFEVMEQNNIF